MSLNIHHVANNHLNLGKDQERYSLNNYGQPNQIIHDREDSTLSEAQIGFPLEGRRTIIKKGLKHLRNQDRESYVSRESINNRDQYTIFFDSSQYECTIGKNPLLQQQPGLVMHSVIIDLRSKETVNDAITKAIPTFNNLFTAQNKDLKLKENVAMWELFCAKKNGAVKPDYPGIFLFSRNH